jgi:hypothetical protein
MTDMLSDCLDPISGEIIDYECALYCTLNEALSGIHILIDLTTASNTKLDAIQTRLDNSNKIIAGSILHSEYYNNQDLDNDGLVYGVDFYISVDKPKLLAGIPNKGYPKTWAEYKAEHPELF